MALVEVKVPDIGDFKDVEIIELLVKAGDTIKPEQSLVTVESDKASMEIPASAGGVVKELKVKMGDKISEGTLLLTLESSGDGAAAAPAPAPAAAPAAAPAPAPAPASAAPSSAPAPAAAPAPAPAAGGGGGGSTIDLVVPDIGDFAEVSVIELLVKSGDTVAAEQSLITVESDKASMEIPASQAGKISELTVKIGDKVSAGTVIGKLVTSGGGASAAAPAPSSAPAPAAAPAATAAPAAAAAPASQASAPAPAADRVPTAALPAHVPSEVKTNLPHASPSVRMYARELGVPLAEVKGSGPKGRITQADVQSFVKSVMSGTAQTQAGAASAPKSGSGGGEGGLQVLAWPKVDFTKFGTVERKPLSRIKKISGANLHRNWVVIPHVTNHEDADITELEAFRVQLNKENEKAGIKVTMLAFVLKACVAALKKFPDFNASLDGDDLVLKQYYHMGFAADTPNGLVVPVIRDVDKKGVLQVAVEMNELAKKARDGKLGPAEMTGGSMSVSSLGGIGGTYFTPIINAPEVSILGLSKSAMKPVWDGKAFVPRLILPMSLSYDHRVIDGAAGARFNTYLSQVLTDFRRVIL